MTATHSLFNKLRSLVRARDGLLTQELLRTPGKFGLGQVPALKAPDATTGVVCGYCSTGCGGCASHFKTSRFACMSMYRAILSTKFRRGWSTSR